MRRLRVSAAFFCLLAGSVAAGAQVLPGLGRPATPKEIAAWDIDVRPDFKGLPKGRGTVAQGQEIWETKCASCHGIFGESNEVFSPLIGGTTAEDVKSGRVARLRDESFPGRTTLMKVPTLSTLWDYINRAMPWNAPKSLKTDEVYAVTAFMLNLGGVLPDNFELSDRNMAEVQGRMPNRLGMQTQHGMWPGRGMGNGGKPDVKATACMRDCVTEPKLASMLPEHARDAHGNLAEQNRLVGAQRGADTTRPGTAPAAMPSGAAATAAAAGTAPTALLNKFACTACHAPEAKLVGPSFRDIASRYANQADALGYLSGKIKSGGVGVWGQVPMPPQALSSDDSALIAKWLVEGARK